MTRTAVFEESVHVKVGVIYIGMDLPESVGAYFRGLGSCLVAFNRHN